MFSGIYRNSTEKTGEYVKELSLSFPKLKTELKNSYWFVFYCCFCLARSSKNDSLLSFSHSKNLAKLAECCLKVPQNFWEG